MAKNEKYGGREEENVGRNLEEDQNDDSPVGEARRNFYSGA